jgi:proteasome lid subunit RPN8/RPN11
VIPVVIGSELLDTLYAIAREAFPEECCGYLRGAAGVATELVQCRNAQADGDHPTHPERTAESGFVISGRELFELARTFSTKHPAAVVYHSHTNGRAYLSTVDRENAIAGGEPAYPVQHLVIGVTAGGVTEAALFAWNPAARGFDEVARFSGRC